MSKVGKKKQLIESRCESKTGHGIINSGEWRQGQGPLPKAAQLRASHYPHATYKSFDTLVTFFYITLFIGSWFWLLYFGKFSSKPKENTEGKITKCHH